MLKDIRFECCGKIAPHKEARCSFCPEPDNRAEPGTPAPITELDVQNIIDWATRDQEECRQCGDEEGEAESRANLAMIEFAEPTLKAAPALLEAAEQAEHWLASMKPGETIAPAEMLRVLRAAIASANTRP